LDDLDDGQNETQTDRFERGREHPCTDNRHGEHRPVSGNPNQRPELRAAADVFRLGVRHCS